MPIWAFDIVLGRFIWANTAALEIWNGKKLSDLWPRDLSQMSDTARARVGFLLQSLQTETPEIMWTFYPDGKPPMVLKIKHQPLSLGDRPFSCFLCQGSQIEGVEPNALRGVDAVHHTPSVISVYEWFPPKALENDVETSSAHAEDTGESHIAHIEDPRGRPLMRNTAAQKLWGNMKSDMHYTVRTPRSGSGTLSKTERSASGSLSLDSDGTSDTSSNEPQDPEYQLGRTFADESQVEEMVESLLRTGRWTCDEVAIRTRRRKSFPSTTTLDDDIESDKSVRWFSYDARVTVDPVTGNPIVLVNALDVSDRRRMARQLEKAKIQAEAASNSKSAFLANISHGWLTAIFGLLTFANTCLVLPKRSANPDDGRSGRRGAASDLSDGRRTTLPCRNALWFGRNFAIACQRPP